MSTETGTVSTQIESMIRELIPEIETEITQEALFEDELEMDSMNMAELLTRIEKNFGIEVPDSEMANFSHVQDLTNFVVVAASKTDE